MTQLDHFSLSLGRRQVLHDITVRPEPGRLLALYSLLLSAGVLLS